jgi:drug/metabolite transporter (DMT)-like permease
VTCQLAVVVVRRRRLAWPGKDAGGLATIGLLDTAANACFALATVLGELGVAAVLTSTYPVTTVIASRIVLGERLALAQNVGVVLAIAGVVLLAAG